MVDNNVKKYIKEHYHEILLEALEEVKPPSIWRDRILFFIISSLGGLGLGLIIQFLRLI